MRVDSHDVSSSYIRRTIAAGDMRLATALLGRPHRLGGRVIVGKRRGAGLGFPTANVRVRDGMHPPEGVYAVRAELDDRVLPAVANLGCNPTFGKNARTLEVHVFDFQGDLYGQRLRVSFIERLRGEITFPSVGDLVAQIGRDAERARAVLAAERD